ncbi:hypothetical protein [Candidatus Albibeggiatoa sp. nov. BB20]
MKTIELKQLRYDFPKVPEGLELDIKLLRFIDVAEFIESDHYTKII